MDERQLTTLFGKLGAKNPSAWAHSQVAEGIPQLARFVFLKKAWDLVVGQGDATWISHEALTPRTSPGGAIGPALERVMTKGVEPEDLTTVVRVMQWRLLASICYLLEDPGELDDETKDIAWRLFQVDGHDHPLAIIGGLHESVLETDPSGNEMKG